MSFPYLRRIAFCTGLALAPAMLAQSALVNASAANADADESPSVVTSQSPKPAEPKPLLGRWLDLDTFSHAERYRNSYNQGGYHLEDAGQQRSLLAGRFKLDPAGRYAIGFRASSGHYFNWAFSDYAGWTFNDATQHTNVVIYGSFAPSQLMAIFGGITFDPAGTITYANISSHGWEFYMRELYFSATPVKAVTVEFGSFGIERGYSSEITTFDDDGYIAGERIRFKDPKHLFFDEVGYTNAFFGYVGTPNFFARGASLKNFNYRQVYAKKQLNPRVGFSGEYAWQIGTESLREAALVGIGETHVADKVRVELYQRLNSVNAQGLTIGSGDGFAVALEKKLGQKVAGDLGYAAIDENYTAYNNSRFANAVGFALNGDTYGLGKRPFAHASVKVTPYITAFGYYTHTVGPRVVTFNKQGFNAGLNLDFKTLINAEKKVF